MGVGNQVGKEIMKVGGERELIDHFAQFEELQMSEEWQENVDKEVEERMGRWRERETNKLESKQDTQMRNE